VIREATLDDAPAVAGLSALVYPAELVSARGIRHGWEATPARSRRSMWLALDGGEPVGFAAAGLFPSSADPGAAVANVYVHPERRRQGLGSALWERVEPHLTAIGATHVNSFGLDEEPSRRFMGARGFEVTFVQRMSTVDLSTLGPPPPVPADVELVPYAAVDDPRPIYELEVEAVRDIPLDQPLDDIRLEDWLERWWRHPELDRAASLLVLLDGAPAAFTTLISDLESRRAASGMTGTARRARGRGLARLVKHHALARAAANGIEVAVTENDERNAPMLAVNERLGYRPTTANATFSRRRRRPSAKRTGGRGLGEPGGSPS
jgi:GNAT superfamily N-acetyltransferase